ncbi:MAG: CDP-alcohol phosphatidyltransferase family protein [Planctomycetota bacterium]|nr:CDP-alcohol phosphatidyltransferase family protein [Planctomycetota bacterium]
MKPVSILPTGITLANAFFGVLALSKAIDAVVYTGEDPGLFYRKMEAACMLVFLGMLCDLLDGWVARATRGFSRFGAQLDSFADALTFGIVPAMLAKVLIEHEGELCGYAASPRIGFIASAAFALMAILRLVRYNLDEGGEEDHTFRGLPSPAAAGAVASTIWLYLILRRPELEVVEGTPTPFSRVMSWMESVGWGPALDLVPLFLVVLLPLLGILMVSQVRYSHAIRFLTRARTHFFTLVWFVFAVFLFFLAPVPILFMVFNGFVFYGVVAPLVARQRERWATR